ncbi:MAG: MFS transporter [Nitriliruptorales bacterium]|nr:MFS transporter [Nitriliruptorales bacterium]
MTAGQAPGRPPLATLGVATVSITLGALPVFLLGALAVFIRQELHFGEARLGLAASLYYLSSAVMSIPGGRFAERLGARRAIAVAATGTAVAMGGAVLFATTWGRLVLCMVLAGAANGIALPATNLALARGIPARHQGAAFGLKQSSGPFATLLAGAAVPALGLTVGWRWAFALAGLAAVPLMIAGVGRRTAPPRRRGGGDRVPVGPLAVLSLAAASAVIAGSSLGAFYVVSAVDGGLPPGAAGTLLAVGSVLGVAARVGWGWVGDHRTAGHFRIVSGLLVSGAAGFALLGASSRAVLVTATFVVFCTGWAWPGLFNFAVVRGNPLAPAAASGITGTGQFAGGILGPLGFGALVERTSYQVAWLATAATLVVAGVLVYAGSSWLDRLKPPAPIRPLTPPARAH